MSVGKTSSDSKKQLALFLVANLLQNTAKQKQQALLQKTIMAQQAAAQQSSAFGLGSSGLGLGGSSSAFGLGTGALSTLGGVGIDSLDLYGLGGPKDQQLAKQGDDIFNMVKSMNGPDSLVAQLDRKSKLAAVQESQDNLTKLSQQQKQATALLLLKKQKNLPIQPQELLQLQQIQQQIQQTVIQGQMSQAQAMQGL